MRLLVAPQTEQSKQVAVPIASAPAVRAAEDEDEGKAGWMTVRRERQKKQRTPIVVRWSRGGRLRGLSASVAEVAACDPHLPPTLTFESAQPLSSLCVRTDSPFSFFFLVCESLTQRTGMVLASKLSHLASSFRPQHHLHQLKHAFNNSSSSSAAASGGSAASSGGSSGWHAGSRAGGWAYQVRLSLLSLLARP